MTTPPAARDCNWDLPANTANHLTLTPVDFLARSAEVYPRKTAIIDGDHRISYGEFYRRCRQFASALAASGVNYGDVVAALAPNVPALLEAHYSVPMLGAVLSALNIRLDPATIAFILDHSGARVLVADWEFLPLAREALALSSSPPLLIVCGGDAEGTDFLDYEAFLASGDPEFAWQRPQDEWDAIALNYTSGTTGNPKGVVYHHRGAYLAAMGNCLQFQLRDDSVYLWTLPMFHCNGWSYTWAVTAAGGTHVCLRKMDPAAVFELAARHRVTHLCGAPIVLNLLVNAPESAKRSLPQRVEVAVGGASPPSSVIAAMETMGFRLTHLYGLTESFGPAAICAWQQEWQDLDLASRTAKMARQGVRLPAMSGLRVWDDDAGREVAADGQALGEVQLRGNTLMKGYLKNPEATADAFAGGWFHSGDLAVRHPDGYVEIKDRAKDIIISGGENISSLEVEEILYRHPAVLEAAVVAYPDEKWGEVPWAFIALKPASGQVSSGDIIAFCRSHMAHFKAPKQIVFRELPKTATGKIQKNVLRELAKGAGASR